LDDEMPDKSTNLFVHAINHHSFQFLLGATFTMYVKAAILDFQDGRYRKTYNDQYLGL